MRLVLSEVYVNGREKENHSSDFEMIQRCVYAVSKIWRGNDGIVFLHVKMLRLRTEKRTEFTRCQYTLDIIVNETAPFCDAIHYYDE